MREVQRRLIGMTLWCISLSRFFPAPAHAQGQAPVPPSANSTAPTVAPQSSLPFPAQLKKTVVFVEADCQPTDLDLAQLPPDDLAKWYLHQESAMRQESLKKVKHPHTGTGFIVSINDDRLPKARSFMYLVTNRHVAQPGIEEGNPCHVFDYSIFSNSVDAAPGTNSRLQIAHFGSSANWVYPEDDSVDLAVLPIVLNQTIDYLTLSPDQFVTDEMVANNQVVEGDPVIFAGLFVQFHGASHLEPIVRSGTVAMLPSDRLNTTLRKLGHVYFADTFSFGGNSGSPLLVDVQRFRSNGTMGYDYRLLGVVAGYVPEKSDFTLQVATDYSGSVEANSGICVIVPAEELKRVLYSPDLVQRREEDVQRLLKEQKK